MQQAISESSTARMEPYWDPRYKNFGFLTFLAISRMVVKSTVFFDRGANIDFGYFTIFLLTVWLHLFTQESLATKLWLFGKSFIKLQRGLRRLSNFYIDYDNLGLNSGY